MHFIYCADSIHLSSFKLQPISLSSSSSRSLQNGGEVTVTPQSHRLFSRSILSIRGGRKAKEEKEEQEEQEQEQEQEESEDNLDYDDDEDGQGDENKLEMLNSVNDMWVKTPPVTQLYLLSSFIITVASFILNKNQWPALLEFDWKAIVTGQVWRIYTAFLFFGPLDPFYFMTMQFVWQHMSQLEKLNYNKPEDFVVMLLFGAVTLVTIYSFFGISMKFLGHNLATYFVYIWSRVFEGLDVNFMDLVALKSEMIPWFFCLQTFLLEREIPVADMVGIVVGHLYTYLKEKKKLEAPLSLKKIFDNDATRDKYARFKDDFE